MRKCHISFPIELHHLMGLRKTKTHNGPHWCRMEKHDETTRHQCYCGIYHYTENELWQSWLEWLEQF